MNIEMLTDFIRTLDPCAPGLAWLETCPRDPAQAWAECERGDWLLWLLGQLLECPRTTLVLAACACARLSQPEDHGVLEVLAATEAWARDPNPQTLSELEEAADELEEAVNELNTRGLVRGAFEAQYAALAVADTTIAYRTLVERRSNKPHTHAREGAAIVRSLFPWPTVEAMLAAEVGGDT